MFQQFIKKSIVIFSLLFGSATATCMADDFPGKGDRFAWSNALPYYNLANKYLEHGRFEEAKTNFEEAIYRYEYDPDFYVNYGVALRKLESYTAAEEAFKKALELRPNDWQSCSNLANAYLKQNKLKETIACFQKAMKMKPPPPPQEREAMLKDIADINKILSMQAPPPVMNQSLTKSKPNASGKIAENSRSVVHSKGTWPTKDSAESEKFKTNSIEQKRDLNKSGWDWVQ